MSLELAIAGLTAELKRYNDRAESAKVAVTKPADPAPEAPVEKAAEKPVAEKKAAKKEPKVEPVLVLADVQKEGAAFVAANGREAFVAILADLGLTKTSDAKDDPAALKAISDAIKAYTPDL
jgi:hypothetical protein